jgi:hypothetical protein
MRVTGRWLLVILTASLGVAATAEHSWASFAGGSRLLMYFTQRSLVNPAAGDGSAITVVGITNQNVTTATRIAVSVVGSNCASTGTFFFPLAPRQTLRLAVASLASPALFPEGFVDVRAVNNDGADIRWDQLAGKILLLDQGGPRPLAATHAAAALFSDDIRGNGDPQGGPVVDKTHTRTGGFFQGSTEFWGLGAPFGTQHRLIVIPVSGTPGTPPNPDSPVIAFFRAAGAQGGAPVLEVDDIAPACMTAQPLSALHPSFAATFPGQGSLGEGGNLLVVAGDGGNKGIVGALLEFSELGFAISKLHAVATFDEASYP